MKKVLLISILFFYIFLEGANALGCYMHGCYQDTSNYCYIDKVAEYGMSPQWTCMINPATGSGVGSLVNDCTDVSTHMCKQNSCPSAAQSSYLDGSPCSIYVPCDDGWLTPSCTFKQLDGKWDASQGKCITCGSVVHSTASFPVPNSEEALLAIGAAPFIYGRDSDNDLVQQAPGAACLSGAVASKAGDNKFDSACGAEPECDEREYDDRCLMDLATHKYGFCNTAGKCIECRTNDDCPRDKPKCDTNTNVCKAKDACTCGVIEIGQTTPDGTQVCKGYDKDNDGVADQCVLEKNAWACIKYSVLSKAETYAIANQGNLSLELNNLIDTRQTGQAAHKYIPEICVSNYNPATGKYKTWMVDRYVDPPQGSYIRETECVNDECVLTDALCSSSEYVDKREVGSTATIPAVDPSNPIPENTKAFFCNYNAAAPPQGACNGFFNGDCMDTGVRCVNGNPTADLTCSSLSCGGKPECTYNGTKVCVGTCIPGAQPAKAKNKNPDGTCIVENDCQKCGCFAF